MAAGGWKPVDEVPQRSLLLLAFRAITHRRPRCHVVRIVNVMIGDGSQRQPRAVRHLGQRRREEQQVDGQQERAATGDSGLFH